MSTYDEAALSVYALPGVDVEADKDEDDFIEDNNLGYDDNDNAMRGLNDEDSSADKVCCCAQFAQTLDDHRMEE
jgi:hypothetical protein